LTLCFVKWDIRPLLVVNLVLEIGDMRLWHILRNLMRSRALKHQREADLSNQPNARISRAIEALLRDTRYSVRRLARDWRFTTAAVFILGLGIGANTAIFSIINATLFRAQHFADPNRLVDIYQNGSNPGGMDGNSYPAYMDISAYTDVFQSTTAALVPRGVHYQDEYVLRSAIVEHTTSTYLSVLGLRPSLGRWFDTTEDTIGAAVVAVVGHEAWKKKFQADPSVIGRTIRIDGVPVTIVGVGPAGHRSTINLSIVTDFWLPVSSLPAFGAPRALERNPDEAAFLVKARLSDGVTVAQAQAAMNILSARLATEYPKEDPGKGITVLASSDVRIHPQIDGLLEAIASLLLVVVGLVLAIACSNLATLLLVRGIARAKEMSVRLALGATRTQLVRHLLVESLLLSIAGGITGCILAWWAFRYLSTFDVPIAVDLSLDHRVLLFTLGVSLITGMAFGLAPALKATRIDLAQTLRGDGETRSPEHRWLTLKNALVVFQVAVSALLLGGTSVFIQILSASQTERVGFAIDGIAILETDARYAGYSIAATDKVYEEIRRRVNAIPGVESAILIRGLPMQTEGVAVIAESDTVTAGPSVVSRNAGAIWAGPGYFDTLRIPILFGRAMDERDRGDTPRVAVISETMARQYFGARDLVGAIGRRFRPERDTKANAWIEVVGVASDIGTADLLNDLTDPTPPVFYRLFSQWDAPPTTVLARTSMSAGELVSAMQQELRDVNARLPVISAKTMKQYLEESLAGPKAIATFLGVLGMLGICLAGIGLYAVVAFAVSRRSREIGIRMALGARSHQVVWAVAREVAVLVGVGTGAGLALTVISILALRAVTISTPGISLYRPTTDPVMLIGLAAFMAIVGVAAAFVPARRAARMDPMIAIRHE
jgi:predicted permease